MYSNVYNYLLHILFMDLIFMFVLFLLLYAMRKEKRHNICFTKRHLFLILFCNQLYFVFMSVNILILLLIIQATLHLKKKKKEKEINLSREPKEVFTDHLFKKKIKSVMCVEIVVILGMINSSSSTTKPC